MGALFLSLLCALFRWGAEGIPGLWVYLAFNSTSRCFPAGHTTMQEQPEAKAMSIQWFYLIVVTLAFWALFFGRI